MADNIDVTPGTGKTVATKDIGGYQFQKILFADPTTGVPIDPTAASPVSQSGTWTVGLSAGSNMIGSVAGITTNPSASFTRPADTTAYASGDLVANSTTAGSVTAMTFTVARANGLSGMIRRARIKKTSTSTTNASFRLHLYTSIPTVTNGDNGVWLSTQSGYLGAIDLPADRAFSDAASGVGVPIAGSDIDYVCGGSVTAIYGLLEARAAYTPTSGETITVELENLQN